MATGLAERWQRGVMGEEAAGQGTTALRRVAAGGARLYEAGLDVYLGLERPGLRRRETLPVPVVSVGNLTTGGTGKTPMTRLLCRKLSQTGKRPAILSRGHGGKGSGVRLVSDAHGNIARSAVDSGDEPLLLAQTLPGVPVLVGKDRRQSGREALRRFALDVLVLDDGFQYWQLARDLDIVLLDAVRPFDNGHCLPRGLLREPPRHLSRAGLVVATRAETLDGMARAALSARVAALAPAAPLFFARHQATALIVPNDPDRQALPLATLQDVPAYAWSAIAQPGSFLRTLTQMTGVRLLGHRAEVDHYVPAAQDVQQVCEQMRLVGADVLVMTEKDAVKWPADSPVPTYALRVEMQVENEPQFLDLVTRRLFGDDFGA